MTNREESKKKLGGGKIFLGGHNIYPCLYLEGDRTRMISIELLRLRAFSFSGSLSISFSFSFSFSPLVFLSIFFLRRQKILNYSLFTPENLEVNVFLNTWCIIMNSFKHSRTYFNNYFSLCQN